MLLAIEKPIDEKDILKMMTALKCSREEAVDVIESDRKIDRGEEVSFGLSKEKEKEVLKEAHKGKKNTVYNFTKRERKPNPTKGAIIAELANYLDNVSENACENVVVSNKEREITFTIAGVDFSLVLTQHRKKK